MDDNFVVPKAPEPVSSPADSDGFVMPKMSAADDGGFVTPHDDGFVVPQQNQPIGEYLIDEAKGVGRTALGLLEGAGTALSGTIAQIPDLVQKSMPAIGANGETQEELAQDAARLGAPQPENPTEVIAQNLTYQPRTPEGQAAVKNIVQPVGKAIDTVARWAGTLAATPEIMIREGKPDVLKNPEELAQARAQRDDIINRYTALVEAVSFLAPWAKGKLDAVKYNDIANKMVASDKLRELGTAPPSAEDLELYGNAADNIVAKGVLKKVYDGSLDGSTLKDYGDLYEKLWLKSNLEDMEKTNPVEANKLDSSGFNEARSVGAAQVAVNDPLITKGINQLVDKVDDATSWLVDKAPGQRSVSLLHQAADDSPTLKAFAESMENPIRPGAESQVHDIYQRVLMNFGNFWTQKEAAIKDFRTRFLGNVPKETDGLLADAINMPASKRVGKFDQPIIDAAGKIEDLMKQVYGYAKQTLPSLRNQQNYLSYVIDRKLLKDGSPTRDGLTSLIAKYNGGDFTKADSIIQGIMDEGGVVPVSARVPSEYLKNLANAPPARKMGFEKPRQMFAKIPYDELKPYLIRDTNMILEKYLSSVVNRTEWARTFGEDGKALQPRLRDIDKELRQSGYTFNKRQRVIHRLVDVADRLQGSRYQNSSWVKAVRGVAAYESVRMLHFMTLSSIQEILAPYANARFSASTMALAKSFGHMATETARIFDKRIEKTAMTKAAEAVGLGVHTALMDVVMSNFGVSAHDWLRPYFKLNLSEPFHRWKTVTAYDAYMRTLKADIQDISEGNGNSVFMQKAKQRLATMGVDAKGAVDWHRRGALENDPFYKNIQAGGIRATNESSVRSRVTTQSLFLSDPRYEFIHQFLKWQTNFGNSFMKRGFVDMKDAMSKGQYGLSALNASKFLGTCAAMIGTALLMNTTVRPALQYKLWGKEPPQHKEKPWPEAMSELNQATDRAGMLGIYHFGINTVVDSIYNNKPVLNSPILSHMAMISDKLARINKVNASDDEKEKAKNELLKSILLPNIMGLQKSDYQRTNR